jgi:hypothetical protein
MTRCGPTHPDELFADLAAITDIDGASSVLEAGGTGQVTRSLAARDVSVTAVEPGSGTVALARQRLGSFDNVEVETSTFESTGVVRGAARSRGVIPPMQAELVVRIDRRFLPRHLGHY